jgi:hypothetical protein
VGIDVAAVLRAHAFVRTEAPPEPWSPDAEDEPFVRVLGEMLGAAQAAGADLSNLTLSFSNVVVEPDDDDDEPMSMPVGDLVAVTVRVAGPWDRPERTWRPGPAPSPFVSRDLASAAERAGAVYGYTRTLADGGAVTVWFRRAH